MGEVKESRILKISNKVLLINDVRNLALVIWNECNNAVTKTSHVSINFRVRSDDDSIFESESISIFDDDSIINLKKFMI